MVATQKASFEELQEVYGKVSSEMESLKEENIAMIKEIQQKSADDEENIEIWEN